MCLFYKNVKTQQQSKHHQTENTCRSRELKPGPLALKADDQPLQHRVN